MEEAQRKADLERKQKEDQEKREAQQIAEKAAKDFSLTWMGLTRMKNLHQLHQNQLKLRLRKIQPATMQLLT